MPENNNHEVLEAIHDLASQVDARFNQVDERFNRLESDVSGLKTDVSGLKTDVSGLKQDMTMVKATMVTKDYLDDKLADLKGDIIVKQRKIEDRIDALVNVLRAKKVLELTEVKFLADLRVFPHLGE